MVGCPEEVSNNGYNTKKIFKQQTKSKRSDC